ncbi:MAG: hypothetical protein IT364_17075 [Candidatus Hydrogenedentes bacterium]|nr:hypothetical protein [Candidatus Hydrogenedentota bacterium]
MDRNGIWMERHWGTRAIALTLLCLGAVCLNQAKAVAELQFEEVWMATTGGGARLATDGQGTCMLVWYDSDPINGDLDIFQSVSTDSGETWSPAVPLNTDAATDTGHDYRVDVAYAGQGVWIAAWESKNPPGGGTYDYDIFYSRSVDNGATWDTPLPLNAEAYNDGPKAQDWLVRLATDGAGVLLASWMRYGTGSNLGPRLSRSADYGATWTEFPTSFSLSMPCCAIAYGRSSDGLGKWIATDSARDDLGNWYFGMSSSADGLDWSPVEWLLTGDDYIDPTWLDERLSLTADELGNWLLAYRWGTNKVFSSTDSGETWVGPQTLEAANPELRSRWYGGVSVATDGQGRWVAVGNAMEAFGGMLGDDSDLLYFLSEDNGASWSAPTPINQDAWGDEIDDMTGDGIPPQIVSCSGSWIVTWSGPAGVHVARTPQTPKPGITVQPVVGHTTEDGATALFQVALFAEPAADVTVTPLLSDASEGLVTPAMLTFTTANWSTPQELTVTGVDDSVVDDDQTYYLTLSAASTDPDHDLLERTVVIFNKDNDTPTQASVSSITYSLSRDRKDLFVYVTVVNEAGAPVAKASVTADLYKNGVKLTSFSGATLSNGIVTFKLTNAKSGTYTTTVTSVVADGLTWDGITPGNSFTK